ncbi:MAG: hypothetical protein ACI8P2_000605, partial [Candidatus Latescibacterota bacterium]
YGFHDYHCDKHYLPIGVKNGRVPLVILVCASMAARA